MEKPKILSYEEILSQIHRIGEAYYSVDHSPGGVSFWEYLAQQLLALIQQAKAEGRDSTIEAINKILSPLKLHLCWITEDGNPEPLSYGLADKYGDEIDVASLQMDRSSQLLKEMEKIGWHGKAEYPCHQYPYFGILEDVWQSFKSKWGQK